MPSKPAKTKVCLRVFGRFLLDNGSLDSAKTKLERRFRNGLNLLASYTYSKTLTNVDSAYAGLTAFGSSDTFKLRTLVT
jgi:hypothetical protein